MPHSRSTYTKDCNLEVNIQKTKIVIFRNVGIIRDHERWMYHGEHIEILNEFCYLGIVLNLMVNSMYVKHTLHVKVKKPCLLWGQIF